jgi:hypothetical protein
VVRQRALRARSFVELGAAECQWRHNLRDVEIRGGSVEKTTMTARQGRFETEWSVVKEHDEDRCVPYNDDQIHFCYLVDGDGLAWCQWLCIPSVRSQLFTILCSTLTHCVFGVFIVFPS